MINSTGSTQPLISQSSTNNTPARSNNSPSRITRYTAEFHVQALRTILIKIAPPRIASLYELHCLDQLLKQVSEKKISLNDCIDDLKGILKNLDPNSPEVLEQINGKVQHRLSECDAKTVSRLAANLASHIENGPGSESLSVIFNAAVAKLLPENCTTSLKQSLGRVLSGYEPKTAKEETLKNLRKDFYNSFDIMNLVMEEALPSDSEKRGAFIKHFHKTFLNNVFSEFLAENTSILTKTKARNLKSFIEAVTSEFRELSNSKRKLIPLYKSRLNDKPSVAIESLNKNPPKAISERDKTFISSTGKLLRSLQNILEQEDWSSVKESRNAVAKTTEDVLSLLNEIEQEVGFSPEVINWLCEVRRSVFSISEPLVRIEELQRGTTVLDSQISVFTELLASIDTFVNGAGRGEVIARGKKMEPNYVIEKQTHLQSAERKAEGKILLKLVTRFVDIKNQQFQAKRKLEQARRELDETTRKLDEATRNKLNNDIESEDLKIEQLESRMEHLLNEMKRNHGSEARILRLAKKEKTRLTTEEAKLTVMRNEKIKEKGTLTDFVTVLKKSMELEEEIAGLGNEIHEIGRARNKMEMFLTAPEDGGRYRSGEFESFFKNS